MDSTDALQVVSLLAVIRQDSDYLLRKIYRWYSKTFFTPLHEVEDLPLEDVLTAYFEEAYEMMPEKKRLHLARLLTETSEEKAARVAAEKAKEHAQSDDAFLDKMRLEQEKEAKALAEKKRKDAEINERVQKELADLEPEAVLPPPKAAATPAPALDEDHEINMVWDDGDNLVEGEDALTAPRK